MIEVVYLRAGSEGLGGKKCCVLINTQTTSCRDYRSRLSKFKQFTNRVAYS